MNAPRLSGVVVGAGIGGLCAAIVLAARGVRVTLVEAAPEPGGKAGRLAVDGVEFDTGPSVLTLPHLLDAVLREAGTRLEDEVDLVQHEVGFTYLYPDGVRLPVHHTPQATVASVEAVLGQTEARELEAFLAYARRVWEAAAPAFVLAPAPSLQALLRPSALAAMARIDPMRTMWGAIRSQVTSPHLRALLARYATYNGSDPRVAPATLNCIAWVELGLGGFGVAGGMYALVQALVGVAERLGVEVVCGEPVVRIGVGRGRVREVVTERRTLKADLVVVNADVAHLVADLLRSPPRRLERPGVPSMSGWTAVLRARRQPRTAHTVLFPEDYQAEFRDVFDADRPPRQPTVYLCAQEVAHRRAGWANEEPLFVMANAPAEPERGGRDPDLWTELSATVRARLLAAGLIEPSDAPVWERTPAGLAHRFPRSRGGLYGWASNSRTAAFVRPPNRVQQVRGLYLASGSAHPGGGVPLCAQSGRLAAEAALEDLVGVP